MRTGCSGGAIRQIQNSVGAVQSPYETTTRSVSMSNSGGAVQSSKDVKPKGNMRNKTKAPPTEPRRYGTRQRKCVERLEKPGRLNGIGTLPTLGVIGLAIPLQGEKMINGIIRPHVHVYTCEALPINDDTGPKCTLLLSVQFERVGYTWESSRASCTLTAPDGTKMTQNLQARKLQGYSDTTRQRHFNCR